MVSKVEKKILDFCINSDLLKLNEIDKKKWENYLKEQKIKKKKEISLGIIEDLIGIFYKKKLSKSFLLLKSWNEYENLLLYPIHSKYRDHFLHQFNVFLMGCYIFEKLSKSGYRIRFAIPTDKFMELWIIASLTKL